MTRSRILLVALALVVAAPSGLAAQQVENLTIAYVDSEALIKQAPGYQAANDAFNQQASVWRDSLEQKRTELQSKFEEYKKQEVILSPEKKTERQQELIQLEQAAQQYFQQKFGPEGEASRTQAELMQPIIEQVNDAIEATREAENISLVFDLNAGALVAGDPALNITDKVVQRLQTGTAGTSR